MSSKVFFIHIPRSGGASLISFLDNNYPLNKIHFAWNPLDDLNPERSLLRGHFFYAKAYSVCPSHAFITTLRNPLDRFLSTYKWLHTMDLEEELRQAKAAADKTNSKVGEVTPMARTGIELAKKLTLEEFAYSDHPIIQFMSHNSIVSYLNPSPRVPTRDDLLHRAACRVPIAEDLECVEEILQRFQVVGQTDNLDMFALVLAYHFGWAAPRRVQHIHNLNKGKRPELSDDLRARIIENNKFDNVLFEQGQQMFSDRWNAMIEDLATDDVDELRTKINERYITQRMNQLPATSKATFTMDDAPPGSNWRERQITTLQQSYREIEASGSTLVLHLETGPNYILTTYVHTADSNETLEGMKMKVGDLELKLVGAAIEEGMPYQQWALPADVVSALQGKVTATLSYEDHSPGTTFLGISRYSVASQAL